MNQTAPILVGQLENKVVWIRVGGKGDFQNSPQIKEYAERMIENGERRFVIDLEQCPVMDSTFMGTLTGIARRLMPFEDGKLEVLNANERNQQLIRSLGLDNIFDLDAEGECWQEERQAISASFGGELAESSMSKRERAEFVMEAHEALTEADPANVPRFRDVIEFLKKELEETKAGS